MEVNGQLHTPEKQAHGTHWIRDWVGPRAGLDAVEKRKPYPPRPSSPQPIVIPTELSRSLSLWLMSQMKETFLSYKVLFVVKGRV
jgi:hypothetical protein